MALTDTTSDSSTLSIETGSDGRRRVVVRINAGSDAPLHVADARRIERAAKQSLDQGIPLVCELAAHGPAAEQELAITFA